MASILSTVLTLAFLTLQVPFGLLFGLRIGVASLIPLGGFLSITLVGLLVTSQNVWLGINVLIVAVVLGQINDNFVAPRVIGNITGLNPAWVLISLLIGAKVGRVLGLLVAVPTASFIKKQQIFCTIPVPVLICLPEMYEENPHYNSIELNEKRNFSKAWFSTYTTTHKIYTNSIT